MMTLDQWKKTTLKNYVDKNKPEKNEVEHILDYLKNHPQERLQRASYPQIQEKAELWVSRLVKQAKNLKESGKVQCVLSYPTHNVVKLLDKNSYLWEGRHMGHCVGSYSPSSSDVYSIRDTECIPHVTMELSGKNVVQCVSKGNGRNVGRYSFAILDFLNAKKLSWNCHYDLPLVAVDKKLEKVLLTCFTGAIFKKGSSGCYVSLESNLQMTKVPKTKNPDLIYVLASMNKPNPQAIKQLLSEGFLPNEEDAEDVAIALNGPHWAFLSAKDMRFISANFETDGVIKIHKYGVMDKKATARLKPNRKKLKIDDELVMSCLNLNVGEEVWRGLFEAGLDTKYLDLILRCTAETGSAATIKLLISKGAKVTPSSYNSLEAAAEAGNLAALRVLMNSFELTDHILMQVLSSMLKEQPHHLVFLFDDPRYTPAIVKKLKDFHSKTNYHCSEELRVLDHYVKTRFSI